MAGAVLVGFGAVDQQADAAIGNDRAVVSRRATRSERWKAARTQEQRGTVRRAARGPGNLPRVPDEAAGHV